MYQIYVDTKLMVQIIIDFQKSPKFEVVANLLTINYINEFNNVIWTDKLYINKGSCGLINLLTINVERNNICMVLKEFISHKLDSMNNESNRWLLS